MVDLLIWVWGGYPAEADPAHGKGRTWRTNGEWLKCNARLGKALRLPLNLLFGLRSDATGQGYASCSNLNFIVGGE